MYSTCSDNSAKDLLKGNNCKRIAGMVNKGSICRCLTQDFKLHPAAPGKFMGHTMSSLHMAMYTVCIAGKVHKCGRHWLTMRDKNTSNSNSVQGSVYLIVQDNDARR